MGVVSADFFAVFMQCDTSSNESYFMRMIIAYSLSVNRDLIQEIKHMNLLTGIIINA